MKYKVGDILVGGEDNWITLEVGGISGKVYLMINDEDGVEPMTEKWLDENNFTLKQEGHWVPELGGNYFRVTIDGEITKTRYDGDDVDKWNKNIGNLHRTQQEAEKYKQWLLTKPYSV